MVEELIVFVKENYFLLGYGITLVISVIYYRRYFDTILKYFPILILYTFLSELLGYLLKNYPKYAFLDDLGGVVINEVIYNIYAIIFFGFFYLVYWKLVANTKYKNLILRGVLLVAISYLISCFFQNPLEIQLFYATAFGSWVLVFCIILYFKDKSKTNKVQVQPHNLMFWVSIALLVFYSILPILFLIGYLDAPTWHKYHLKTILRIFIVIMYGILIIGFTKGRRHSFG